MPRRRPVAVIDACVLANQSVGDLMLRLAEDPILIIPRWSDKILEEVRRTHQRLGWPDEIAGSWQEAVWTSFPEAMFEAKRDIVSRLTNQAKDRHVLGTAIAGQASIIVTFNLRDFKPADLAPWKVTAVHPDRLLCEIHHAHPELIVRKVRDQATRGGMPSTLAKFRRHLPLFTTRIEQTTEPPSRPW